MGRGVIVAALIAVAACNNSIAPQCQVDADCGTSTACATVACTSGMCTTTFVAAGTPTPDQTPNDCKVVECDGSGNAVAVPDGSDLPSTNGNPCEIATCGSDGTPALSFAQSGTACGTGLVCNDGGTCVGCLGPLECPGSDTQCEERQCLNNSCGFVFTSFGVKITQQVAGDCQDIVCDGSGGTTTVVDDSNVPETSDACLEAVCTDGVPSNPFEPEGTPCGSGSDGCDGSGHCDLLCGNGIIDSGEQCDGSALGGASCQSEGFVNGTLTCSSSCTFDLAVCSTCGDGIVSGGEVCDGSSFGGATCETEGFATGTLACSADCSTIITSGCSGGVAPGSLDPTFGSGGSVMVPFDPDPADDGTTGSFCVDLAIDSDSRIAVFGDNSLAFFWGQDYTGAAQRLLPDGSVDPTFPDLYLLMNEGLPVFESGAVTADDGVVVAGISPDTDDFAPWLAEYSATGTLVEPFGSGDGEGITSGDYIIEADGDSMNNSAISTVVTPSSGFVVGFAFMGAAFGGVARETGSGMLDPTFGSNGTVEFGLDESGSPQMLALDAGGSNIYVAGDNLYFNMPLVNGPLVVHVDNTGTIDAAFDATAAAAFASLGSNATNPNVLAVAPDGSLFVAGSPGFLIHLSASGALDTSFGANGLATAPGVGGYSGIALQHDDKIVVMTGSQLVRFLPNGQLDATYGTSGVATTPIGGLAVVRIQADDAAVVCGSMNGDVAVARIAP